MCNRTRIISVLTAVAVAVLVMTTEGQGRSSDVVTCSSTAPLPNGIDLTGAWKGSDLRTYSIRQVGTCVWWAGYLRSGADSVFFGSVSSSGSTVFGVWAYVPPPARIGSGRLIVSIRSSTLLVMRGSTGGFPARSWKR
jgi:hypothetical protein